MAIVEKDEWHKLHIAKFDDWTLSLSGSQHVLGWLMIFPPRAIEKSIVYLTDDELIKFKKIGLIAENLLIEEFNAEWFNYLQQGNGLKRLHIHLQPRYSSKREFEGFTFTDENWGRPVKFLPKEDLAQKELVFKIVKKLREVLSRKDIKDFKVEILNN